MWLCERVLNWPLPFGTFQGRSKTNNSNLIKRVRFHLEGGGTVTFESEAEAKCCISDYPKQIKLVARVELELGITRVRCPDHNITIMQSWSAEPIENNFLTKKHTKTWPTPIIKCFLSDRFSGTLYCTSTSCLVMSCESVWPLCWTMAAMISVARSRSPPNIKELSIFWVVSWDSSLMRGLGSAPTAKFLD